MCGRYYIDIENDELSFVNNYSEIEYKQNFNVAPQNQAPCIIDNNLIIANWGYFPEWLKSQSNPRPLFNTRYESLLEKKTFTSAFKNSRCLIPISGWYEWKEEDGIKQPYYFLILLKGYCLLPAFIGKEVVVILKHLSSQEKL